MKESINQRFKKILDEKKISQAEFAKLIGVSKQNVNNWYNNSSPISVDRIVQILEAYEDIDARWFLTGSPRAYNVNQKVSVMEEKNEIGPYADKDYIIQLQKNIIEMKDKEIEELKGDHHEKKVG